jgi:DNA helicase-2/ATP-dependent DNA helicase PcrA
MDEELYGRLKEWRLGMASLQKVPAYVVFTDATLIALAERRPTSREQLVDISGIGPRKLGLYAEAILALVGGARPADLLPESSSPEVSENGSATS